MEPKLKDAILNIVTKETGVSADSILSSSREREIVRARNLFIALARKNLFSYTTIGRILKKDHSTIIYSIKNTAYDGWIKDIIEKYKVVDFETKQKKIIKMKLSGKYGYLHHIYGGRCAACGFDEVIEVHHIIPKHLGGTDDQDNLIILCPNHHSLADRGMLEIKDKVIHMDIL